MPILYKKKKKIQISGAKFALRNLNAEILNFVCTESWTEYADNKRKVIDSVPLAEGTVCSFSKLSHWVSVGLMLHENHEHVSNSHILYGNGLKTIHTIQEERLIQNIEPTEKIDLKKRYSILFYVVLFHFCFLKNHHCPK